MTPHNNDPGPLWSAAFLLTLCKAFDAKAWPALSALALISAVISTAGLLSQFTDPDLYDFLLCALMGTSLWMIARIFWAGTWQIPYIEAKNPLMIFGVVATLCFSCYAAVSVTANLSATAGEVSEDLAQQGRIDRMSNAGQGFVSYVGELNVIRAALEDRAEQARGLESAEIAGNGPTGEPGVGSVSNSYAAAVIKYVQAADLLEAMLQKANGHVSALNAHIAELRVAQIDTEMSAAEKRAHLKTLEAQAIGEMPALLSLDPARVIRQAAQSIAEGVPARSQAKAQSRARIAEISAEMRRYAVQLQAEADRIEAQSPDLPEQVTLSMAERLFAASTRLPALTMAALLLDLCGWIGVGFRLALYRSLKLKIRDENEKPLPSYITLTDLSRVEEFLHLIAESKRRIEAETGAPKRGRPRLSKPAAKLPKPKTTARKRGSKKPAEDKSNDKA
ncbi:hypothetical protein J7443_15870 [Tropicibacter sp. R15_0]|uniref:hypothetical protein n=1 Tax=Tropicibacter sp. R15_0 TaxID=2821101 RepID=UPI001ADD5390|nr:hypothetical protein [Tropicibacter sp. R15_0]MBO9466721.1 hypothetical protein [Tropicibacter sp. R15_0]